MTWAEIDLNPSPRVLRQFAAACLIGLGVAALGQWFLRDRTTMAIVLGGVGLIIGAVGLVRPPAIRWVFVGATILAFPIGWVLSQVMLLVLFIGIVTPVALILRLTGRDRLRRARPRGMRAAAPGISQAPC